MNTNTQQLEQNIAKIEREISSLEQELALMKEQFEKSKKWKWEPTISRNYFVNGSSYEMRPLLHTKNSNQSAKLFKDLKRYLRLWHLAEELNEGWEPDWSNSYELKWFLNYVHEREGWDTCYSWTVQTCQIYFKDKGTASKAIDLIVNHGALED